MSFLWLVLIMIIKRKDIQFFMGTEWHLHPIPIQNEMVFPLVANNFLYLSHSGHFSMFPNQQMIGEHCKGIILNYKSNCVAWLKRTVIVRIKGFISFISTKTQTHSTDTDTGLSQFVLLLLHVGFVPEYPQKSQWEWQCLKEDLEMYWFNSLTTMLDCSSFTPDWNNIILDK